MMFRSSLLVAMLILTAGARPVVAAEPPVDFSREVLPLLSDNCFHCHGPDEKGRKAKLRLDTREGAYRVKEDVAVVVPGNSAKSELVKRIFSDDPDDMMPPPDGVRKLTPAQRQTLKRWVDEGAKWGTHWAFVPPTAKPAEPTVKNQAWVKNGIDRFILARLEKESIPPQSEADKARLLRRVSLDLTGLSPTPAEIDAFLADKSADAYEKLVDRLLASPRYGERMASDWLDIARFADTHGYQMDRFRPMHAYRDWVIKAFNENLPFDQFATWQLAGDLLPNATKDQRLATAFNRLHSQNEEGGIVEEEFRVAYVVDRVNTMGTAFLGMTFECTRCHDHKYDPITQKEFYSLFAFFQNIDESGQTPYFTGSMPVPTMLLSTDEQDAKLKELDEAIRAREKDVATAKGQATGMPLAKWLEAGPQPPSDIPGTIAHFTFDEIDKNQITNRVDPKSVGKGSDNPVLVDGPNGKAAALSGESGFTFPAIADFSRVDPFSMSIKLRAGELAERAVVVHKSRAPIDAGSRGFELLLESGQVAFGMHHMWPGNSLKVRTKDRITKDAWTTVSVTYDGSSRAGGVRIYIEGKPAELEVIQDDLWKDITYGGDEPDLAIGFRFRDNGFRNGQVDDFYVFNREITALEVEAITGKANTPVASRFRAVDGKPIDSSLTDYYVNTIDPKVIEARKALHAARKAQSDFINPIPEAMVMKETRTPKPAFLLKRGNYDQHGDPVSATTPAVMPAFPADQPHNRLGLARWLTDPQHPLTGRVTVNRLWQQMFGRGIVETSDNFGSTGAVPSHPELLDYLTRVFIDDYKWDQKRFLKYIAMSATYRQSSQPSAEARAKDPTNLLLSHMPPRRLTAEMLRDQALSSSGLLVEKLGGPSVKPYQPAGLWDIAMGRPKYDQGKGEDLYRRSLYTYIKRTVAPPAMLTFDAADRSYCTIKRQTTSTPLQSLTLLNDVQVVEASRKVAERMIAEGGPDDASRVKYAFRLITGRQATDRETTVLVAMLAEQRALFAADRKSAEALLKVGESKTAAKLDAAEVAAGSVLAQAIFNHDEAVMRR
ncbi:DUF1553 domain-containing protein [Humisphaera borealis]|uniref:DUF1553 domain-containing protein n=1 Tax=Humisphaera borealis TaxID=2807512 RepID=A0A7M2X0I3_9BACT|nr:DUF1553 domain-containing protein [Humisphaera borealis]QOV91183.1 DUF1553 domain-containing protein [Humisphaera borealis]